MIDKEDVDGDPNGFSIHVRSGSESDCILTSVVYVIIITRVAFMSKTTLQFSIRSNTHRSHIHCRILHQTDQRRQPAGVAPARRVHEGEEELDSETHARARHRQVGKW